MTPKCTWTYLPMLPLSLSLVFSWFSSVHSQILSLFSPLLRWASDLCYYKEKTTSAMGSQQTPWATSATWFTILSHSIKKVCSQNWDLIKLVNSSTSLRKFLNKTWGFSSRICWDEKSSNHKLSWELNFQFTYYCFACQCKCQNN